MKISCDFVKDFHDFAKRFLLSCGVTDVNSIDNIEMLFWKVRYRIPSTKTRKILRATNFTCPNELQNYLANLEHRVQMGETLRPFLSKGINDTSNNSRFLDNLLSDWGIHHFHLGKYTQGDFSERTRDLLFAIVTENEFYEIAILPHGCWTNQQLLEIIFTNWKHLLTPYILPGISVTNNPDEETLKILRNAHVMTLVRLSTGECLVSPGGGYASDGTPTIVVENHDKMAILLRNLEKKVKTEQIELLNNIAKNQSYEEVVVHLEFSLEKMFEPDMRIDCY